MDNMNMENVNVENNEVKQPGQSDGMGIAALVLGIVSIVMSCCITYVGLICGIIGLVLAIMSNKKGKNNMATAGLVCSIIGIILSIILIIVGAILGPVLYETVLTNYSNAL